MNNNRTGKNWQDIKSSQPVLKKYTYFIFGCVLVVYFFFMKTMDQIVNYPDLLLWGMRGIFFVTIFLLKIKFFIKKIHSIENIIKKGSAIFYRILKSSLFAWFTSGILLIPMNYYMIYRGKEVEAETKYFNIEGLVARPRNNKIFYDYNGSMKILYGKREIMDEIYKAGNFRDYQLKIILHKSFLGSFIIEEWDIVKKIY